MALPSIQAKDRHHAYRWVAFCCMRVGNRGHACSSPGRQCRRPMKSAPSWPAMALPNASITSANTIAAGTFSGPPQNFTGRDLSGFFKTLPAFCRVVVKAKPTSDSDIAIEVWMPLRRMEWTVAGTGERRICGPDRSLRTGRGHGKGIRRHRYRHGPHRLARSMPHGPWATRRRWWISAIAGSTR